MVARGWGWDRVPPRWEPGEQDAGDPQGPPNPTSSTLAPTDRPASCLTSRLRLMPITADDEFSQNNPDTGRSTEGRSIGDVRDQSAPTVVRVILFISIIGPSGIVRFPKYFVKPHHQPLGMFRYPGYFVKPHHRPLGMFDRLFRQLLTLLHNCPLRLRLSDQLA